MCPERPQVLANRLSGLQPGGASAAEPSALLRQHALQLFAPSIVQATAMGLLVPVLPLRAAALDPSESMVGLVVSGRGAGTIAGGPLAGAAIAALGLRTGLIAGLGLATMGAVGGAIAPSEWVLITTRLLAGVGLAFFTVGRQTYVAQNIPPTARGSVSAFIAGTTRLGTTIGPAAGGGIVEVSGTYSTAFWLEAALFATAAGMVRLFHAADGAGAGASGAAGKGAKGAGAAAGAAGAAGSAAGNGAAGNGAAKEPAPSTFPSKARWLTPVLIVLTFVRAARELLLPLQAAALGAGAAEIGMYTAASFAVDTALVPLAGCVMDRCGRRHAGAPALGLTALGLVLLAWSSARWAVLAAALVLGLGNGMSNGWIQTVGADLAPEGRRPQFLGVWNLLMGIGTAAGPAAIGAIAEWRDLATASLAAAAVALGGAAWYLLFDLETLPPPKAAPGSPPNTAPSKLSPPAPAPPTTPPAVPKALSGKQQAAAKLGTMGSTELV